MFQRILVPLDGSTRSEQAIPVAALIAQASRATLILLRVANVPKEYGFYLFESYIAQTPMLIDQVLSEEKDKARNYLDIVQQMPELAGIQVEPLVLNGAEAQTILETTEQQHADLMVMSGHGNSGFKQGTLGSVAMKVTRHSTCPVLVLRQEQARLISVQTSSAVSMVPILVALDGSTFAEAVLGPAATLAQALAVGGPGRLHLLEVLRLPHQGTLNQQERETIARWRTEASHYLNKLVSKITQQDASKAGPTPQLDVTWSLEQDHDVAGSLIHAATEGIGLGEDTNEEYGVLALATHGRGGLQSWAVGSTTDRVIKSSELPLLIVRPAHVGE